MTIKNRQLDEFTVAYLVAALWSTDDNEQPLDANYELTDISEQTLDKAIADCTKFQTENAQLLAQAYEKYVCTDGSSPVAYAGHDFWLTRNKHGCGYWDRNLDEIGGKLTDAADKYGEIYLYAADGEIYD